VVTAGRLPSSADHAPGGGSSRKHSSTGADGDDQPIFSRGPTMDGHGNTLPSSHGLAAAAGDAGHAMQAGAAAAAAARVPSAGGLGVASGSGRPAADVLTIHAAAKDLARGSGWRQEAQNPAHADGSVLHAGPGDTAQSAAPQPSQFEGDTNSSPGVTRLPQGILRRSRSWAAQLPHDAGSSSSSSVESRVQHKPVLSSPAPPAGSGHESNQMARTQQMPVEGMALAPQLRRASAPVSQPPSPTKQRRRGLFR
jgi:hypothetical protein